MTNKILNWGFLSTARINRVMVSPLQISKRNRLLAVGSRTQESADAYAAEKKIERAYGSYESLLADPTAPLGLRPATLQPHKLLVLHLLTPCSGLARKQRAKGVRGLDAAAVATVDKPRSVATATK